MSMQDIGESFASFQNSSLSSLYEVVDYKFEAVFANQSLLEIMKLEKDDA